ncbi:hypothetical protein [Burkholderia pseudomultivorans]|uniref:hypothetical protein n=1 Tax=Burkholderia pseudomultivorans TaxID=1207504 RepID=UPI000842025F|nr:hypothetical protein [Burkholderia pseudomultivorans]AOI92093.1 hypothetical protein WS57_25625 [Burkholderia pseudomultivorans]
MLTLAAWWAFGALVFLAAFWCDGEITVEDAALAFACGISWPVFLPIYLLARYGKRVIWRRK